MTSKLVGDLLNFFRQIVNSQKIINLLKQDLLNTPGFNLKKLFLLLAQNGETITIKDLQVFLKDRVACNERQLYDIFQRFDHHRCGFIILEDFIQEMSACDVRKKCKKQKKSSASTVAEAQFRSLLSVIIRSCRVLDTWRKQLEPATPYIIFQDLNRSKTGVISKRQLFHFFYENSQQLNKEDASILYKSLLRRHYRQLNLEVFCENFKPLEFGHYPSFKYYLEHTIQSQLIFKQKLAKEAVEVQQNYLKNRRNEDIIRIIHNEAALNRQRQLEKRIEDELKAYNQLKYLTKKKFHPELRLQEFIHQEKENEKINLLQIEFHQERERLKSAVYLDKMRNIQTLKEIQHFQAHKREPFQYQKEFTAPRGPLSKVSQQQLEKRIRNHAYSARNAEDLLMKRELARNLQGLQNTKRML